VTARGSSEQHRFVERTANSIQKKQNYSVFSVEKNARLLHKE
jgi:hypothetical protein